MPNPLKSGAFPTVTEAERINTIQKYNRLYETRHDLVFNLHDLITKHFKKKNEIIYISHALPAKITDFYGDFVQGDDDRLQIALALSEDDESDDTLLEQFIDDNDLIEMIFDIGSNQSQYGYDVLLGYKTDDDKYLIQQVPADQYFPQSDGSVIFASIVRDPNDANPDVKARKKFYFIQHYYLENNKLQIKRSAWTLNSEGRIGDKIGYEILGNELPEEEVIDVDEMPIAQIDNGRKTRWGFGKSDYVDVMPQIEEINEKTTQVSIQLLKNMNAKLILPDVKGTHDEEGNPIEVDTIYIPPEAKAQAQYVLNTNPMVEQTFVHVDKQLRMVSTVTGVPLFELADKAQPEKVESLRIKMFSAMRRTNTKRSRIKRGLRKILRVGYKLFGDELENAIDIQFSDVLPTDPLVEAQVEQTKVDAGISSRRSAMKRVENYTDEEVDAELEQINEENIQSGAVNANNAPQL